MKIRNFIQLLFIGFASCYSNKQEKKQISTANDSIGNVRERIINKIDTTIYVPVGNGFYKHANGDIFELKKDKGDDSLGWYIRYYLDSTLVDEDYSSPKALKEFIDLTTYAEDTNSYFSKDRNHVYFVRPQSGGHVRFIVQKADPKTFIGLKERWGKDNKHIFYGEGIVEDADVHSFSVYKNSDDTAKDKRHIYVEGEIIK
jgi:hypothetical protein